MSRNSKEYWNDRALKYGPNPMGIFHSTDYDRFNTETRRILELFKDRKVLDVGCGYGRLSDIFSDYTGIDFSEEMINLARTKFPDKRFDVTSKMNEKFDVIFECMCLSSLEMIPEQFNMEYKAPIVICLEPHQFTIFYNDRNI